ncbi:hypothetical protein AB0K87_24360 [Streptomyces sp. NPDC053705]|uniref:hypothetical protein n=1 Tax=Streptomyces sp. NPDC053705 TaxID=3156668 RepID=UPI0034256FD8
MNRNGKHPGKTPHRRKAHRGDTTKNSRGYRVTGSWNERPDRPAVKPTQDRRARDRMARDMAEQGAYVIVEEHVAYGLWRTLYEVDGPALLAERAAAEEAEADRLARDRAAVERQAAELEAARRRRDRLALEASTHARALMSPPAIVRPENRQRARHITGAQR